MGGTSFTVRLRPLRDGDPTTPPEALLDEVIDAFDRWTAEQAPADHGALEYYFTHEGNRDASSVESGRLEIGLKDMGGGCWASLTASLHWLELFFAVARADLDENVFAPRGFRLAEEPPDPRGIVIGGIAEPLVWLRRGFYTLYRRGARPTDNEDWAARDEDTDAIPLDGLTPVERAHVDATALTGQCECQLCGNLRLAYVAGTEVRSRALRATPASQIDEADYEAAIALFEARDYSRAAAAFEAVRASVAHPDPNCAYGVACCWARQGDLARAVEWLGRSFEDGWDDLEHLHRDEDLASLRTFGPYLALVARHEPAPTATPAAVPAVAADGPGVAAAINRAWDLLDADAQGRGLAIAAARALRGLPSLATPAGLVRPAELAVLGDWLEERAARPPDVRLIGLVLSRPAG